MSSFNRYVSLLLVALPLIGCSGDAEVEIESDDDTLTSVGSGAEDTTRAADAADTPATVLPRGTDSLGATGGTQTPMERPIVSTQEQQRIDAWLTAYADSLNDYGDPKGTMYAGGTPLFNEAQGKPVTKYEYIVAKHPEKPWNQPLPEGRQVRRETDAKKEGSKKEGSKKEGANQGDAKTESR